MEADPAVVRVAIDHQKEYNGNVLPLVFSPAAGKEMSASDLASWATRHRDELLTLAMNHGVLLFRGFAVDTPEEFAESIEGFHLENMPYVGGAAVRRDVVRDVVFTANESPPSEPIPFHHEMAQVPRPPSYLFFYCEVPPSVGGETPLIHSTSVCNFFSSTYPEFFKKVCDLGVKYIRVLPEEDDPTSAIGRSWRSTYQCTKKEEAEEKMRELGTTWEWLEGGNLKTTTATLPAIREEPRSKQQTFFNSVVAAFTGWTDSRNDPTKAVVLGDDSPADPVALQGIADFMHKERVAVPWAKGDVMFVDNTLAMHSRNPFEPPRRILASITRGPLPLPSA